MVLPILETRQANYRLDDPISLGSKREARASRDWKKDTTGLTGSVKLTKKILTDNPFLDHGSSYKTNKSKNEISTLKSTLPKVYVPGY